MNYLQSLQPSSKAARTSPPVSAEMLFTTLSVPGWSVVVHLDLDPGPRGASLQSASIASMASMARFPSPSLLTMIQTAVAVAFLVQAWTAHAHLSMVPLALTGRLLARRNVRRSVIRSTATSPQPALAATRRHQLGVALQ